MNSDINTTGEGLAGVFARQSATGREVPGSQRLLSGLLPPLCVF